MAKFQRSRVTSERDGFAGYGSTPVNEYLEDRYPEFPLMPADPRELTRVGAPEDYRDQHFHVGVLPMLCQLRDRPGGQVDPSIVEPACEAVHMRMERLEAELACGEYLPGSFSLADTAFIPNFAYPEDGQRKIRARFPRLRAGFARYEPHTGSARACGL